MSSIVKISDAAALGLHALAYLVHHPTRHVNTRQIAQSLNVSEAHLAKVMQRLEHHQYISSKRGPNGGFTIKASPEQVSLLDIYTAIEGQIKITACMLGQSTCNQACPLGHVFSKFEREIIDHLKATSLAEFADLSGIKALRLPVRKKQGV